MGLVKYVELRIRRSLLEVLVGLLLVNALEKRGVLE